MSMDTLSFRQFRERIDKTKDMAALRQEILNVFAAQAFAIDK